MTTLSERLLRGDRRALARLVTLIENDAPQARTCLTELHPHSGQAHIIGVTGSPGAGKSTLVTHLVREFRKEERRVGVVAIDPSSPFTGGALLGDRIRMMELAGDPDVFIRSMASRGNLGGLSASTRDVIRAMDAAGYNPIIVETVGTGQAEVEVMRTAQTVLVVMAPGMGDDIQAIKAGILEIADIFVVSKADKPDANRTAAELSMMLSLDPHRRQARWRIPIIKTSMLREQGITELTSTIHSHLEFLRNSGMLAQRTQRQIQSELQNLIVQAVTRTLHNTLSKEEWQQISTEIVERKRDPYTVAEELQERIGFLPHNAQ
ncbi:MAG TPA: methylmalonyl Co-A mutase-associated GTPase MeaB [Dictyobacter sp.]|nr:methylmalonyl Co-A mutase-associated GTPase MeaB [Dictyobacter sp.]